jgi:phosphatidylglycerophosphatase A
MTARTFSPARRLIHFLAFGFGAGYIPRAPGTAGTLVAVPVYLLLRETELAIYLATVVLLFVLGIWLCGVTERDLGKEDAPGIVWDEIVGYLVAMTAAPAGWVWIAAGFGLFRLFDIVKPFPIRMLDQRVPGGLGVMLDDVLAGVYALIVLQAGAWLSLRMSG